MQQTDGKNLYHQTFGASNEDLATLTEEHGVRIPGTNIRPTGDRSRDRDIRNAEMNAQGEPQRFPYDSASSDVIRAANANPGDTYLTEVAGSIRDHRASYGIGHNGECRADLYRGFCH